MASDGKVSVSTALDNKGLEKGINNISGSFGGLKSVAGKLGGIIAAAFSVKAIIDFSKAAIDLGSDLEEVQNVVNVSFGSMAGAAEEFAKTAIMKFGMSELAAKQTASTYMAMAKGMGVAEGAASDMAISLAGLSGDVASFYNLDQEEAAKKLQGVFTGESEALKSLGVVMTQTNLKQFALEKGMNANIDAMSQAELVALRYAFVTDALSLAAGDFERTQDSWANQTRILSMQWQQFMGTIGQSLTTVLTPAVKLMNELVGVLNNVAQKIRTVVSQLFGKAAEQTQKIASAANTGANAEKELAEGINEAGKAAKKTIAGFDELNTLQSGSGGGANKDTSTAGGGYVSTSVSVEPDTEISPQIQNVINSIKRMFEPLKSIDFSPLQEAFNRLGEALSGLGETIANKVSWAWFNILVPLGKWVVEAAAPAALDVLSSAFDALRAAIDKLWPVAMFLWDNFLKPLAETAGTVIVVALREVADLFQKIAGVLSGEISISKFFGDLTPVQTALVAIAGTLGTIKVAAAGASAVNKLTGFFASVKNLNAGGTMGKLAEVFAITTSGAGSFTEAMSFAFGDLLAKMKSIGSIALIVAGAVLLIKGYCDGWVNGVDWGNFALVLGGIAAILGGIYLKFGALGASIGAVAAGIALIILGVKDFISNGASLQNTILIIGGAIAVAVGLATAGLSVLVSVIVGAVAAVAAFTAAILLEEPAIMSTKEAQEQLTAAKQAAAEAENGYINAVDAAESAMKRLENAEKAAGVTGEELYKQVQDGTLDYVDMTDAQKECYKAYLDNEQKQKDLEESTKKFNDAKKAETIASYENQLALAKESGNYDDFKKSVVAAFESGELSAEEARELIGKSMSEMSDDSQKTFMEDLPGDIKDGLDPSQYETTRKKMGDWFKKVGRGFIENVWQPVKDFWNKYISPVFTANFWKDLAKKCGNGLIAGFEGAVNGIIQMFESMLNWVVGGLNKISFDVPDWVPGIGGKKFGFNISTVKFKRVSIPRLAQGAVIPPNKEFMAVLGDQRHGTNIEAPLTTIQEAVAMVMQDQTRAILAGFEASVGVQREILEAVLGIQIGDDVIGNAVARYSRKQTIIRGGAL